jgi:hypothetical protein
MSSATSTSAVPSKAGSYTARDEGFRVPHFFVLLSLVAATVAVVLARPAAPENLVLISLTIGAAGLAAIAFYKTIAPLVAAAAEYDLQPMSESLREDLEREKALTLRSIKELEFDKAMGKLSQQDFDQMAGRLRARAMGIMKQLDAGSALYREQVEKELAARLETTSRPDLPASAKAPADKQVGRAASKPVACACGTKNDPDAKFCKSCGAKLQGSAA